MSEINKELRCVSCGKLIGKGHIAIGKIEIKCKCGVLNTIAASKPEKKIFPR